RCCALCDLSVLLSPLLLFLRTPTRTPQICHAHSRTHSAGPTHCREERKTGRREERRREREKERRQESDRLWQRDVPDSAASNCRGNGTEQHTGPGPGPV
ncbi:hypothetical protein CHARACLAT_024491, partial [Characodon lateralis]|nr:hypothetical protein [Characodon lateralis]